MFVLKIYLKLVGLDPASFDNFAGLLADLSGEAWMSVAGASRRRIGGFRRFEERRDDTNNRPELADYLKYKRSTRTQIFKEQRG
ncbi:MAG: hypothetical protein O3C43_22075 [Verrucomicrobia bacterium]|nr:hypothetical protein [Verrucomicrobiota bacterium]MDA1069183.1 hypothetical protein [Verrucomicrobiota bacterium]